MYMLAMNIENRTFGNLMRVVMITLALTQYVAISTAKEQDTTTGKVPLSCTYRIYIMLFVSVCNI